MGRKVKAYGVEGESLWGAMVKGYGAKGESLWGVRWKLMGYCSFLL